MAPETDITRAARADGHATAVDDGCITFVPAGTSYRLLLQATGVETGDVRGTIDATALKVHPARGGGRFIEPVDGEPRIVAGHVRALDESNGRMLVRSVVAMWITLPDGADTAALAEGGLVNFHVKSGATFVQDR